MPNDIERRFVDLSEVEMRLDKSGDEVKIAGYSAVFDKWSQDLSGFKEKIAPGAFKKSLRKNDVVALFNHDANMPLGRKSAGNLKLKEDETGLYMELTPTRTSYGQDLVENIDKGVITQQSFAFRTIEDDWIYKKDGTAERTLIEVDLLDVSPVTYPAYVDTSVALRKLDDYKKEHQIDQKVLSEEDLAEQQRLSEQNLDYQNKIYELKKKELLEK